MAITSVNPFDAPASTGVYKDIEDVIFDIEGNLTTLLDMAGTKKAKGVKHYWEERKFTTNTANTEQKSIGQDLSADTPVSQTEYYNEIEYNAETYHLSSASEAIAKNGGKAGVKNYFTELRREALIELKGKLEASLLNGVSVAGANTPTAGKMDGLIQMALINGSTTSNTVSSGVAGAESIFRTLLQTMRTTKGGLKKKGKTIMTSFANIDLIMANWKGRATAIQDVGKDTQINANVTSYVGQFGAMALVGHDSFADSTKFVIFEKEFLNVAVLENTTDLPLATTGLAKKFSVYNAMCLQYDKPSTLGYMEICG